jgi:hypothetical protein
MVEVVYWEQGSSRWGKKLDDLLVNSCMRAATLKSSRISSWSPDGQALKLPKIPIRSSVGSTSLSSVILRSFAAAALFGGGMEFQKLVAVAGVIIYCGRFP